MTKAAPKMFRAAALVCLTFLCTAVSAQDSPTRPEVPVAERPVDPAIPEVGSGPTATGQDRAPVTYWDEYQRAADEADADAAAAKEAESNAVSETADDINSGTGGYFDEVGPDDTSFLSNLLSVVFWLCVLLALFLVSTYLLRTLGQRARIIPADSLATIIGRLYLAPRFSLHFVRTGGRVLVIGMTPSSLQLIAELDEDAYPLQESTPPAVNGEKKAVAPDSRDKAVRFLEELKQHQNKLQFDTIPAKGGALSTKEDDQEITSLRGDIARLQQILKDTANDPPK